MGTDIPRFAMSFLAACRLQEKRSINTIVTSVDVHHISGDLSGMAPLECAW